VPEVDIAPRPVHALAGFDLGRNVYCSTIGGTIPELWGVGMPSYTSLIFRGIQALVGLWTALEM
jgi:hypothetical protein